MAKPVFIKPVNGPVTSPFGSTAVRKNHNGIDYGIPTGTPVKAAHGGTVSFAGWDSYGGGNMVGIKAAHGTTFYAHNSSFKVSVGQKVRQGQIVALSGNTGNSTGPHLHFMYRPTGSASAAPMYGMQDPNPFFKSAASVKLKAYQRKVNSAVANYRLEPSTSSKIIGEFNKGDILDFKGYVKAQKIKGNGLWYVGKHSGGYIHSSTVVGSANTKGLKDLTPKPVKKVAVKPAANPPRPAPDVTKKEVTPVEELEITPPLEDIEEIPEAELTPTESEIKKDARSSANRMTGRNTTYVVIATWIVDFADRTLGSFGFDLPSDWKVYLIGAISGVFVWVWQYLFKAVGKKFIV